jgi:hypothetical protein
LQNLEVIIREELNKDLIEKNEEIKKKEARINDLQMQLQEKPQDI